MPAFMIAEMTVKPGPELDAYRTVAAASIAAYGGRFVLRGARKVLREVEGDPYDAVVMVEFPDADTALAWYRSQEYAPALAQREKAMIRRLSIVETPA